MLNEPSTFKSPLKLPEPITSNWDDGLVTPMPSFPPDFIIKSELPEISTSLLKIAAGLLIIIFNI